MSVRSQIAWSKFYEKVQEMHQQQKKFWPLFFCVPFGLFFSLMVVDMFLSPEQYDVATAVAKTLYMLLLGLASWYLPYPPKCIVRKDGFYIQRPNFVFPIRIVLYLLLFIPLYIGFVLTETRIEESLAYRLVLVLAGFAGLAIIGCMKFICSANIIMKEVPLEKVLKLGVPEWESKGVKDLAKKMWEELDDFEIEGYRYVFKPSIEEAKKNPNFTSA